ncbi:MAG: heme biosynthesis protein HemY [Cohaesibacter sp.]|nr:heme biosynthesis protein HemY [Cohaesibacter sp.]
MIKTLILFAVLLVVAFGGAWLADRPGVVTIDWLDYRVEVTFLTGVVAFLTSLVVAIAIWITFRTIWLSPKMVGGFFSSRRRDKGYKALSTGMIAVGVGDLSLAQKQAVKARKLIGQEPMTLMLEAQTAQLAGNVTKARQSFEAMLDHDDTRALGRRGLFIEAQRRGDGEEAMEMARSAMEGGKSANWAGAALFDMQTAAEDWQGALITLSHNQSAKQMSKEEFRRKRAVILTAQAQEIEKAGGSDQEMKPLLLEAVKLAPGLTAAAVLAAQTLKSLGEQRKAGKVLEAAWKQAPHPDVASSYAALRSDGTALDRLKRVRSLSGLMPDDLEAKLALGKACLEAREWSDARSILEPLAQEHLTPRICMMMAQVEEGQDGDFGRVREWLARAVSAHRDPVWTADGQVSDVWQPTSPVTGKLDAFEWKVPVQELADYARPLIEADEGSDGGADEEVVLLAPSDPMSEQDSLVSDQVVDEDKIELVEPDQEEERLDRDDEAIVIEREDASEAERDEEIDPHEAKHEGADKKDSQDVEFAMPHAPDDPGPKKKELPNTPEKRFRLF